MRVVTSFMLLGGVGMVGVLSTSAFADLPVLWRVQLQARSTNSSNIATFNLPAGATMTNQTAAISEDGYAAVHYALPAGSGIDGFFVGRNGTGHSPVMVTSGTGFSSTELDFSSGLLTCVSLQSPSFVSLRSAVNGAQSHLFNSPNVQLVNSYSRPRIIDGGNAIGYRGGSAGGIRKWIIETDGPVHTQSLYLADGPATNYAFLYPPSTNSLHHMGGKVDDLNGLGSIIRCNSPLTPTVIFDGAAANVDFIAGGTDLNDNDQMAFFVRYLTGPTTRFSLLRSDGVTTTTLANAGDAGIQSSTMGNYNPSINNGGVVAFRARDAAGDALFVADGRSIIRIVGHGDSVGTDLGSLTLGFGTNALSGQIDINNSNLIAFCGILSNNSIGLFIAKPCYADFNMDTAIDFFDYLDFVNAFSAQSLDADFNHDGVIDFFDYLDFVDAFNAGC